MTVTGGTVRWIIQYFLLFDYSLHKQETGHGRGTHSHSNGYKIDISLNPCINSYITKQFSHIGKRGDGAALYKASSGNVYAKEGNHWDIAFTASC